MPESLHKSASSSAPPSLAPPGRAQPTVPLAEVLTAPFTLPSQTKPSVPPPAGVQASSPAATPPGCADGPREHQIATPLSLYLHLPRAQIDQALARSAAGSNPTTQHGGAAAAPGGYGNGPREDHIASPLSLLCLASPDLPSPNPAPGSVKATIMSPPTPRPPPALLEKLVEEVLLRFPPDDPALLVRAALVCKHWCRLISGPGFRRRFREFHRKPPMLGFFLNLGIRSFFVRTSATCPPLRRNWRVIDARHGRVLLDSAPLDVDQNPLEKVFIVWDPITDQSRELSLLPVLGSIRPCSWNAAVLCAAGLGGTCDHLDCHRGPFLVVLVGNNNREMLSYVYSSEAGAWSEPTSAQHLDCSLDPVPGALVGNSLYLNWYNKIILKYSLGTRQMSVIHLPANCYFGGVVLMTMEDGGLGFAIVVNSTLYLWSWEPSRDTDEGWAEIRFIELKALLPVGADPITLYVIGCADSIGVIFLYSNVGILTIDLKSSRINYGLQRKLACRHFPLP